MAVLQVLKGLNPGQQFPLEGDRIVLGRNPDCEIFLDVGAVSRQHAEITKEGEKYYVKDLKSRNGTYVNGRMIDGLALLHENDRLKICDLLFTFHYGEPGSQPDERAVSGVKRPAVMVEEDAGTPNPNSTVMSTLSVASSMSLRVGVKPEAKLKAMIEITQTLATAVSLEDVLPKILDALFKIFTQADRGFVLMVERESGMMLPKAVRYRKPGQEETIRVSKTIINKVMQQKEAILSADAASDTRFELSQSVADFRIRSMMCAPMFDSQGEPLGVLQLDTQDQMQRFEQDDLDVLASVAAQSAFAIENAQLHETLFEQQMLQRELDLAHKVQKGFLPMEPPQIPGYHFFDFYRAAKGVGGDFYDYVPLPGNRLAVVLGDVSGKGIAAALLMAKLSSDTRYSLVSTAQPSEAVTRLNALFCAAGWEDRFVTFVLLVIDLNQNEVTLVNAGHMPPLLRKVDGTVVEIDFETGLPIGVSADFTFGQHTMPFGPGESLTIFTDGISEAMNRNRDLYGVGRLRRRLTECTAGVAALGKGVLDDVRQFVGQQSQSDDMCVVCFGRQVPGQEGKDAAGGTKYNIGKKTPPPTATK
jgi:serine phosphatase RsbU (regulator of sigma subunit)/pSer/pThr/pTyr-binding forkhead associated (FHA) protein